MTEACMNIHIHLCTHVCGDEIMVKHKLAYFDNKIIMIKQINPFPIILVPLYSFFFLRMSTSIFSFFNIKEGDL